MKIRKFEGATMRDAVAKVKAELGEHAVILSTRDVRRGLLGTAVEISAGVDDDSEPSGPVFGGPQPPPSSRNSDVDLDKAIAPLRSELRSLRALVRAANDPRNGSDVRSELTALRKLVEDLRQPSAPSELPVGTSRNTKLASPVAPSKARRVMLVGPTGVGKTTTIAKLAARAALLDERSVSLVTLDHYRIGGFEQIRTFAQLIGVPLAQATDAAELEVILEEPADLVLIDTSGRSPRDTNAIAELALMVERMPDLEVHLVIAAATGPSVVDDLVARYAPLRPSRLLFTKIDEIDRAPELSNAPARHGIPVTWVTTGQRVPEDLEEPTAGRLLELAAGGNGTTPPTPPSVVAKTMAHRAYKVA